MEVETKEEYGVKAETKEEYGVVVTKYGETRLRRSMGWK